MQEFRQQGNNPKNIVLKTRLELFVRFIIQFGKLQYAL